MFFSQLPTVNEVIFVQSSKNSSFRHGGHASASWLGILSILPTLTARSAHSGLCWLVAKILAALARGRPYAGSIRRRLLQSGTPPPFDHCAWVRRGLKPRNRRTYFQL